MMEMIASPQLHPGSPYELSMGLGNGGNLSYRQRGGSKGKRGRPISAYPVPHSYPGQFSHIGESVESTQASHLTRFTHNLARTNASRK